MEHNGAKSAFVLLQFDEMVAAAQRSYLKIAVGNILGKNGVLFIFGKLLLCLVKHRRRLCSLVMVEARGDISENIAHNRLKQSAVSRNRFTKERNGDICLNKAHSAADVNAYRIGYNSIFAGNNAAYGHSLTRMSIGHKGNPFVNEGELRKVLSLFKTAVLDSVLFCPYLDWF